MTPSYEKLLRRAIEAEVKFIVIGGIAAIAHGLGRFTQDIDLLYQRSEQNLERLTAAFSPLSPELRGAPPGLPFKFDLTAVRNGLNFTLTTSEGDIDLLGEIPGGNYDTLKSESTPIQVFGLECLCLNLDCLIRVKRAAGRPKDFEVIAELEELASLKRDET